MPSLGNRFRPTLPETEELSRPISNLEFRIGSPDVGSSNRPICRYTHWTIGQNRHQGNRFEIRGSRLDYPPGVIDRRRAFMLRFPPYETSRYRASPVRMV